MIPLLLLVSFAHLAFSQIPTSLCYSFSSSALVYESAGFSRCFALTSSYSSCGAATSGSFADCICNQQFFNAIIDCESEHIECLDQQGANGLAQTALSNWHKTCDSRLSSLTTPVLSSLTTTKALIGNPQYCSHVAQVCAFASTTFGDCLNSFPATTQRQQFLSCVCQEPIISAASVCEYDNNKTCLGQPAAYSNIDVWNACPAEASSYRSVEATMISKSSSLAPLPTPGQSSSVPQTSRSTSRSSNTDAGAASASATGMAGKVLRSRVLEISVAVIYIAVLPVL